jgi:hypothetical protein
MKDRSGEHPFADTGQLIALVLFLIVWAVDSFFLKTSTFLSSLVPLYVRLIILAAALVAGIYLAKSGHGVVEGKQRPQGVVSTGALSFTTISPHTRRGSWRRNSGRNIDRTSRKRGNGCRSLNHLSGWSEATS